LSTVSIIKLENKAQKVVLLFGPTAVGKTELLVRLFEGNAEVISADSMQAYRGLDIGTAKPGMDLCALLPHHLVDFLDPDTQYNAGEFVKAADRLVAEISARGRTPVISGGTPFYLRNFIYGLPGTPPGDPGAREQIASEIEAEGTASAYRRLLAVDPEAARRISPGDTYRISRALEVYLSTGKKLSSFPVSSARRKTFDMLLLGLARPREELNRRIELRVNAMFGLGLVSEVASLIGKGYGEHSPGMQGIGYREFLQMRSAGCLTVSDVKESIIGNTRRYAKRQMAFFKRFPETFWFHPGQAADVRARILGFLG